MNVAQSKSGAGMVVRMTPAEFDRLGAAGRYVGVLQVEGRDVVVALVIQEDEREQ